jgi:hypothetical protein
MTLYSLTDVSRGTRELDNRFSEILKAFVNSISAQFEPVFLRLFLAVKDRRKPSTSIVLGGGKKVPPLRVCTSKS